MTTGQSHEEKIGIDVPLIQKENDKYLTATTYTTITNTMISGLPPLSAKQAKYREDESKKVIEITRIVTSSILIDKMLVISCNQIIGTWESARTCCSSMKEMKLWLGTVNIPEIDNERKELATIKRNIYTEAAYPKSELLGVPIASFLSILIHELNGDYISWPLIIAAAILFYRAYNEFNKFKAFLETVQRHFQTLTTKSRDNSFSNTIKERESLQQDITLVSGRIIHFVEDCDVKTTSPVHIGDTEMFAVAIVTITVSNLLMQHQYSTTVQAVIFFIVLIAFLILIALSVSGN